MTEPELHITQSPNAQVEKDAQGIWHLEIPANARGGYRLAQLDQNKPMRRSAFTWEPPFTMKLEARVSAKDIPGTWGFGLWNFPFSFFIRYDTFTPHLPTLPEAAWFFHASQHSYLSIWDNLPARGFLAATFNSTRVPSALLAFASPYFVLSLFPGISRLIRKQLRRLIRQDAALINTDVTQWHGYRMEWEAEQVNFSLDGTDILQTRVSPRSPLSLVIWVDNQYAEMPPKGRLRFGQLPNPEPAWMEIKNLSISPDRSGKAF